MAVAAKKRFGQHFLKDKNIALKICQALDPANYAAGHTDLLAFNAVLEVGPGQGILTRYLYDTYGEKLFLVEIDADLVPALKSQFSGIKDHIIEKDFLALNLRSLSPGPLAVIGNFPYNISSQILFKMVENSDIVPVMVGMFQKEVAQRIAATPGNKIYGLLSVWLQAFFYIEYLFTVAEGNFLPPPKVKSAVIRLTRKETTPECDPKLLLQVIKAAFNQRRKTLRNALKTFENKFEYIHDSSILNKRAEELGFEEFAELTRAFGTE